ncbi:MAG: hypothetical protein ABIK92_21910 [Pseudomonadota bacterium]
MKYIIACITENYWQKSRQWLDSVIKFAKPQGFEIICFTVGFDGGNHCRKINRADITNHEKPGWCRNRKDYISLEGGEFLNLFDFKDDDLVINSDVDMVMMRPMTSNELSWLNRLDNQSIALALDENAKIDLYDSQYISSPELRKAFPPQKEETYWTHYCGVMAGYVPAWKKLHDNFKFYYKEIRNIVPHHAIGQWTINYVLHTFGGIEQLPRGLHEAPWWNGNKSLMLDKKGKWYWKNVEVCFLHHKFHRRFGYIEK